MIFYPRMYNFESSNGFQLSHFLEGDFGSNPNVAYYVA